MQLTLFLIFAVIAIAGAVNLLLQRHPIYSALSLVTVMFALAVEYLILGAEFIAFIQIIVYAGAIMVLFVFVIMVLNADVVAAQPRSRIAAWIGGPVLALLSVLLVGEAWAGFRQTQLGFGDFWVQTGPIGQSLFHKFLLPFEVTSVLFLVGVLGAVVLAARQEKPQPAAATETLPKTAEAPKAIAAGQH